MILPLGSAHFPRRSRNERLTLLKGYASDQEEARRFYVDQLGLEVAEDRLLGDYRWLLVRMPDNEEVSLNLETARTDEEKLSWAANRPGSRSSALAPITACGIMPS